MIKVTTDGSSFTVSVVLPNATTPSMRGVEAYSVDGRFLGGDWLITQSSRISAYHSTGSPGDPVLDLAVPPMRRVANNYEVGLIVNSGDREPFRGSMFFLVAGAGEADVLKWKVRGGPGVEVDPLMAAGEEAYFLTSHRHPFEGQSTYVSAPFLQIERTRGAAASFDIQRSAIGWFHATRNIGVGGVSHNMTAGEETRPCPCGLEGFPPHVPSVPTRYTFRYNLDWVGVDGAGVTLVLVDAHLPG